MLQEQHEIGREGAGFGATAQAAATARVAITDVLAARGIAVASYPRMREIAMRRALPLPQIPERVSAWHTWELVALVCGVSPEVAAQGRDAFLRSEEEGWPAEATYDFSDALHLLKQAQSSPDVSYWGWLEKILRHSPASQIG